MTTVNHSNHKAQTDFTVRAKVRLVELGWSVTELARRVSRSRTAVSIAINHPTMFPRIQQLIKGELGL